MLNFLYKQEGVDKITKLVTEEEIKKETKRIEESKENTEKIKHKLENHKGIAPWKSLAGLEISKEQAEAVWRRLDVSDKVTLLFYLSELPAFLEKNGLWIQQKSKIARVNTSERFLLLRIMRKIDG